MFNGQGVYFYNDGGYYNGTWLDNNKSGKGERLYPNGDKYSGEWRDDKRYGTGLLTIANTGQQLKGFWENDIFVKREK
jgi:hypothetical protein